MNAERYIQLFGCFICITLLSGCASSELSPEAYLQWLNKPNGIVMKEKVQENILFKLQYLPSEAMALREYGQEAVGTNEWPSIIAAYDSAWYFQFRIQPIETGTSILSYQADEAQQEERLQYFSFAMQRELKLLQGTDTLNCSLFHFERSYQLAPFTSFLLAFEKKEHVASGLQFVYRDTQLGIGDLTIPLGRDMFIQLPKLQQ